MFASDRTKHEQKRIVCPSTRVRAGAFTVAKLYFQLTAPDTLSQ